MHTALGAGATMALAGYPKTLFSAGGYPVLAAVMGAGPDVLFDKGIEAMGGMRRFVKPNQTVVIKPNIGWDQVPERGANTNPVLVKQIVKHCHQTDHGHQKPHGGCLGQGMVAPQ